MPPKSQGRCGSSQLQTDDDDNVTENRPSKNVLPVAIDPRLKQARYKQKFTNAANIFLAYLYLYKLFLAKIKERILAKLDTFFTSL